MVVFWAIFWIALYLGMASVTGYLMGKFQPQTYDAAFGAFFAIALWPFGLPLAIYYYAASTRDD